MIYDISINMIYLSLIPDDLLENYIFKYLNCYDKVFLNKENYIKYHYIIMKKMDGKIFEKYLRDIIRLDYKFVFNQILNEKLTFWLIYNKCIRYEKLIFPDYFEYINYLINKHNSGKIKNLFIDYLKKNPTRKVWKDKIIKTNNNKWLQ